MRYILYIIMLLTFTACFSAKKWQVNHPKKYEKVTNLFVEEGGCITPTIIKHDTFVKDSIHVDSSIVIDTFIKNNSDTVWIVKTKFKDSIKFKTVTTIQRVEDSTKIKLLKDQINQMGLNFEKKQNAKNNLIYLMLILIIIIYIIRKILK